MKKRSERLSVFLHAITAFVLILKGASKLEHPEGHWFLIVVAIGGGALTGLGSFLHGRFLKDHRYFEALVSFVEGLALGLVGLASVEESVDR